MAFINYHDVILKIFFFNDRFKSQSFFHAFFSDDSSYSDDSLSITNSYQRVKDPGQWRDLLAYWIFGLCNNFGYVVMLTVCNSKL